MDGQTLNDLVHLARAHHPGFALCGDAVLVGLFERYAQTTYIQRDAAGRITGFAVWQDWGEQLGIAHVIAVVSIAGNVRQMIAQAPALAPGRQLIYFDETLMEARRLCRP